MAVVGAVPRTHKMQTQADSRFFVRLWLDESIRTMAEVKGAFKLLFWYVGRITVEYATDSGVRCGGVHGLSPVTDGDIAGAISRIGAACTGDQVYKWRHTLARRGYVAWKRTPVGQRTFVIGSEKFPADRLERLPWWAADLIDRAILVRTGHSSEVAEGLAKNCDQGKGDTEKVGAPTEIAYRYAKTAE